MSGQAVIVEPEAPPAARPVSDPNEVSWDPLPLLRRLIRRRWLLLGTTLCGLALGLLLSWWLPPYYIAQAVFLPPKSADVLNPPPPTLFGGNDPSALYLGMLQSRTVADDVIAHLGLKQVFHVTEEGLARKTLDSASTFTVNKNSFIQVAVRQGDPVRAAAIANAYLEALVRLNGQMVASGSTFRRQFYEQQLEEQKQQLTRAETSLRQTEEASGIVSPSAAVQAGVNATASLTSEIGDLEARLASLLTGATEQNPQVVQLRSQIAQLRGQLARQQAGGGPGATGRQSGLASNGQLPAVALANEQKLREVKLEEETYRALMEQYQKARLSSLDPGPQLQIIDLAQPPERKSGPSRRNTTAIATALGLVAGLLWLLAVPPLRRFLRALRHDPATPGS